MYSVILALEFVFYFAYSIHVFHVYVTYNVYEYTYNDECIKNITIYPANSSPKKFPYNNVALMRMQ